MALALLSPGVLTREVDLTVGRTKMSLTTLRYCRTFYSRLPVNEPILIQNEQELINTFGKPVSTDAQYEYWMSASSFLSYGGIIKVVSISTNDFTNANAGVQLTQPDFKFITTKITLTTIKPTPLGSKAAKNPGSWSNGLKVCVIDDAADQIIGIATTSLAGAGATIGYGVTTRRDAVSIPKSDGTVETFTGYLKGIITGLSTDATNSASKINVRVVSRVSAAGTETAVSYEKGGTFKFDNSDSIYFVNNSASNVTGDDSVSVRTINSEQDWYDQQQLGITNGTVYWNSIAPKPTASAYVTDRDGKNDGIHVVVVDDNGEVTGIKGNVLEKHLDLSKALDAVSAAQAPLKTYYKNYIADFSEYVFAGFNPSVSGNVIQGTEPQVSGFTTSYTKPSISNGSWGRTQGNTFNVLGNVTYSIGGGVDYTAAGVMTAELSDQITAYNYFRNKDEEEVDYLIMGPGMSQEGESGPAARLISIAGERKDCVAVISPHRGNIVGQTNATTMTNNVLGFFNSLPSSSYAIFDSGYKYMFDRFNNEFRYVPCNADIAGLMVRTNINFYPWFSPAGQQRHPQRCD